jgi:hypothetical protein
VRGILIPRSTILVLFSTFTLAVAHLTNLAKPLSLSSLPHRLLLLFSARYWDKPIVGTSSFKLINSARVRNAGTAPSRFFWTFDTLSRAMV